MLYVSGDGPKAQVPQLLDRTQDLPQDMLSGSPCSVLTVQIYLRYLGSVPLTDVILTLEAPAGIHLSQVSWTWQGNEAPQSLPFAALCS